MRILVRHAYYGCDTGCCGHVIEVEGEDIESLGTFLSRFHFAHPYGNPRAFAERLIREELGEEHVKDLDWENCEVLDD